MAILTRLTGRDSADSTAERVNKLIGVIAESSAFRSAPMMRTLLLYLWEQRGKPVSEYAIAVDALGRPSTFDPKSDSAVRVQVARLRAKLKEFYEAAGDTFPLRLSIPLGRHELQVAYEPPPRASLAAGLRGDPRRLLIAAAILIAILTVVCVTLFMQNRSLRATIPASTPLPLFWRSFLASGKPTTIVVPSPLYFFWPQNGLYVRDLKISEFDNLASSPYVQELSRKLGPPTLAQTYVGAMEMGTGARILQFLDAHGQPAQLVESRKFSTDSLGAQNTIFLGMPRTAVYLQQLSRKLNFHISQVEPDVVANRHPQPGEPAEFRQVDYSAERIVFPEIIALLPARPERTRTLLLLGRGLTGIPAMLTTLDGIKMLDEQWKKAGSPDAFEMVVAAELYRNDTVLTLRPVAFRPIAADFWK